MTLGTITHDPKDEAEYTELRERRRELRAELAAVNREVDQILAGLGELVAKGAKYKKQTDRLAALRSESEAINLGILHLTNRCDLLCRFNPWLTTR